MLRRPGHRLRHAGEVPWEGAGSPATRTFDPAGRAERDVERLGRSCGPANGMEPLGSVIAGEATARFTETRLDVTAGECLRIFAVAEATVPNLMVEVVDAKGKVVASDHNSDRWPILNPDGPFCMTEAAELTIRVRARVSRGRFAMQIWKLP